jgi:hypothetical protein
VRTDRAFLPLLLLAATPGPALAEAPAPPPDLVDYVQKVDRSFAWSRNGKTESDAGTVRPGRTSSGSTNSRSLCPGA